jgi:tetratricopeptide (TPR) repeat protein
MKSTLTKAILLAAGVCVHAGCAGHTPPSLANRFMLHRGATQAKAVRTEPPSPTLEEAIGKVRRLMAEARPAPNGSTPTMEGRDPELMAARARLLASPTAANHLDVAAAYYRLGLLDNAYDSYMHALALSPHLGEAYDGVARIWRDWGLPHLGLGDAYRAVYYAPGSAAVENTLGTMLQALGHRDDARNAYELSHLLDPEAAYPLSNLCYLSFLEGKASSAIAQCQSALHADATFAPAHNNLALIYAAIGRLDLASREFARANPPAGAAFNMGVVLLAQNHYSQAAEQFELARTAQPSLVEAAERARQARLLAHDQETRSGGQR